MSSPKTSPQWPKGLLPTPFQPWEISSRDGDTRVCSSLEPASVGAHSPIDDVGALDDSASPITCALREQVAYSADAELYEARNCCITGESGS